ncbi:MAG: MFS transporter [Ignavibacteriaceae bacterium]
MNKNFNTIKNAEQWTLVSTILASSMVFIDFTALNVALPAIQNDFNISGKSLLWIINAYSIFLSSLLLVGGSIGDIFGRKKIFIIGIILFSASSLLCGISNGKLMLIISRAFQGIGGALMVPESLAIISAVIPSERRGKAFGTWSTFSALTTIIGPVLGGWLAGIGLWRIIFFINIPLAVFTVYVLLLKVPESRDESANHLDITGAFFATLGLGGITYGFLEASDSGFKNLRIEAALVIGFISLITFIIVEKRSRHPMMPLNLFKSKTFSGVNTLTLLIYAALNAALFFFPLNLIQIQGYPEEIAGLAILPFAILISGISRFSGKFSDKFGARKPLIIGPLLSGLGLLLLIFPGITKGPAEYWTTYFPGIFLLGLGMGIVVAPLTTAVMASVKAHHEGIASGINNTVARMAGLLAIAVLGTFMIISFKNNLEVKVDNLKIPAAKKIELLKNSNKLAETRPPDGLSEKESSLITLSIKKSFIASFNMIIIVSVILSWLSSLIAFFSIDKGILKN